MMPIDPIRVRDLFLAAADQPAAHRAAYLASVCGDDVALYAAVERLLAAHEQPAGILDPPAQRVPTVDYAPITEQPGTRIGPYIPRHVAVEVVEARSPSTDSQLPKVTRKNRVALTTTAAIGLLLVAGVAVSVWQAVRATRAEAAARVAEQDALRAQQAEAERADGEKKARQEALTAAQAEKTANVKAQKRLTQIEKGNEILTAIFADLDLRKVKEGNEPLEAVLAKRLAKAAEQLEGEAISDPLVVASLQDRLGLSLDHLGYSRDAIPLFLKALETRKATLGTDHPDTLMTMNNLAESYRAAGKPDLALPLYEENLKLAKARLGADHRQTLAVMNNLAMGYQAIGKGDLALPLYEEAVALMKARIGIDHPDTLAAMNNLAQVYANAGKHNLALPLFEETLKFMKVKPGADHPDTLGSMNNLAEAYHAARRLDLALPLFEETVKLRKARLGADHRDTLSSMGLLALVYQAAGKNDQAVPLLEETLGLQQAKLGADHPDTLTSRGNLAVAYRAAGKVEKAVPLYEETLRLIKARFGADHPDTLTCMGNLAGGYRAIGKLDKAVPIYEEAARSLEKRRFQHPHAFYIVNDLIGCYEQLEKFDQAEVWRRKCLAVVKQVAGGDSLPYAAELAALGLNLLQQKKWTDAEPVLRESLALREKKAADDWTTFNTKSMLGGALLGQQKYADAEPLLLAGYEVMKKQEAKIPPQGKVRLVEALERLVQLYEATDTKDEAARWRKELETTNVKQK